MTEWRIVPSYPWIEASSDGHIRRAEASSDGRRLPGRIIKGSIGSHGYRVTSIKYGLVRADNVCFHVLVCEAFHGPKPSPDHEVAHNDGTRLNNDESNLRWATRKENAADRKRHGTQERCRPDNLRLTQADIVEIHRLKGLGYRGSDIAVIFDVDRNHANRVAGGKCWADANRHDHVPNVLLGFGV